MSVLYHIAAAIFKRDPVSPRIPIWVLFLRHFFWNYCKLWFCCGNGDRDFGGVRLCRLLLETAKNDIIIVFSSWGNNAPRRNARYGHSSELRNIMQRTKQDIHALIEKGETFHLECKKAQGGLPSSLWESYSAFCNTDGGVILLGVKEFEGKHFEVVGVSDAQKLVQDFTNTLNDRNKVSANVLTDKNVQIIDCDGKTVVVIEVPRADRADKPVYLNKDMFGQTYRRQNEGDYHVPKHIVRRMVADQFETFDNVVVPHTTFDDIDETTLKWYRNLFTARQEEHPFSKLHGVDFLRNIGGYDQDRETKDEGLTLAGLLMFGNLHTILRCVPEYNVDYREYSPFMTGVLDRWIDRDTTDFTWPGNLFSFFLRVTPKLYAPIKVPFKLDANMQRIDETAAHTAIREAMVNTLVHADYGGRMGIVICRWYDRIEFRNAGLLRMSREKAVQGWNSDCRNKGLQKMFQFLGYSEKAGSGFPKIFMGTDEQHWARPTIREDFELDQTYLNMPTVDVSSASADVSPPSTSVTSVLTSVDISERQWKILTALAERECSATELLKVVGMDDRVNLVQRYIKPLIKKDVVGMTAAPNSPQQKYKLLPNGSKLIREMETSRSNGGNDISS